MSDYRDMALADAALDHVLLLERIQSLEADVERYRELLRASLDALRDVTLQRDAILDEQRRCRELWLARDGVAA